VGEGLRERGAEYGATTGRPRRCGWFDAVAVRYATRVNGFDAIALTKLDVLDTLAEIPVCTSYRFGGETLHELPADGSVLEGCEPVYETLPGWQTTTAGTHEWAALPAAAKRYVDRLGELAGCPIGIVSTGPDRDHTILRAQSAIAGWFQ
jgi:adenylosuccinate synthase